MNTTSEQNPVYGSVRSAVDLSQLSASAVSWGAIFAGAAAAAALSLILLILGTGLGLSSVSPWVNDGVSATTFGVSTIIWVTFTQLVAAGMGGYLAGRLRTKWVEVHTDEVYFRDTAHGFLAWAIATLATAALFTSVIGAIVSGGASMASGAASTALTATVGGAAAGMQTDPAVAADEPDGEAVGYFLDTLFRRDPNPTATAPGSEPSGLTPQTPEQETAVSMAEVTRIFMNAIRTGEMPEDDVSYVAQVVVQRTGLTQPEAEQRVTETLQRIQTALSEAETTARETADSARKASAYMALWMFISLLIGAFVASFAAPYGGRQRDA